MKKQKHQDVIPVPWEAHCGCRLELHQGLSTLYTRCPLHNASEDLLRAVKLFLAFFDDMPKGQFGKIVCNWGTLNEAFMAASVATKKTEGGAK